MVSEPVKSSAKRSPEGFSETIPLQDEPTQQRHLNKRLEVLATMWRKYTPFNHFLPKRLQPFLNFSNINILPPSLLSLPRSLLELLWWVVN